MRCKEHRRRGLTWRKHMEDVCVSPHSTSADQQHTDSKIMGASFDTSLYTRLKFIPRSYEKYDWFKQNALMNSLLFFDSVVWQERWHVECYWNVLRIEFFVLFCIEKKTARRPSKYSCLQKLICTVLTYCCHVFHYQIRTFSIQIGAKTKTTSILWLEVRNNKLNLHFQWFKLPRVFFFYIFARRFKVSANSCI